MRKTFKGISAVLMTSVLAISASAATMSTLTASAGSIKVDTAASEGNTYKAYQILKGDVAASGSMSRVDFGDNLPALNDEMVAALKTVDATVFTSLTTATSTTEFATMISNLTTDAQKHKFARVIGKYVTGPGTAITTDEKNVADGYYVVKEEGGKEPISLNILRVAGSVEIEIAPKEGAPESDKTVDDINDSTGVAEDGLKTADYDIGDHIPYTLTFTLPSDYALYEVYPVTFIDDMCPSLLFDNNATIYFGNADTTGTSLVDAFTATTITADGEYKDGKEYTYSIADLKTTAASLGAGDVIKITYTATLTDDAVIGAPGNPNSYKVVYASDPNWTATPGPGETTPPEPPTSETPAKKNVVFTYKLIVNKVDDDGNDLTGANFALYKWTDSAHPADVNATGWTIVGAEITATNISEFEFNGLDDGIYKLVETKTPDASYNQIDPMMFEITATHNDTDYTFELNTDLQNSNVSGGEITVEVENNKGIVLPGTGGIGTTIFYIVGSLMVGGALVLFVVRKRMNIKEQ